MMILEKVGPTKNGNNKLTLFPQCDCCGNMADSMYHVKIGNLCGCCLWILGSLINSRFKMDVP